MENKIEQLGSTSQSDVTEKTEEKRRKEPVIFVIVLNLLFGGSSYILLHYYKRFFILMLFMVSASFFIGSLASYIAIVIALVDTYMIARKYNDGKKDLPPKNKKLQIASILLIVLLFGLQYLPENLLVFNTRTCDRLYPIEGFLQGKASFSDTVQKRIGCYGDVLKKKSYIPSSPNIDLNNNTGFKDFELETENYTIDECEKESFSLKKACYFYYSYEEGSAKYCNNNAFSSSYQQYCVIDLAKLLNNKDLCKTIDNSSMRGYCERRVDVYSSCQDVDCQALMKKSDLSEEDEEFALKADCCLSGLTACDAVLDPVESKVCIEKYSVYEYPEIKIDNSDLPEGGTTIPEQLKEQDKMIDLWGSSDLSGVDSNTTSTQQLNETINAKDLWGGDAVADVDSDSDGLFDREELEIYKTNPHNSDTDGDGYSDGDEVKNGYNPNGDGLLVRWR